MTQTKICSFILILFVLFTPLKKVVAEDSIVIRGVHLLTMEIDVILSGQTIIINNGMIVWVGDDAEAELPADAPQIFNPPGFSAHRELALLTEAGLTPLEAIKTGTVNVGIYLGEEDTIGKIAPGFRADLLFLSVNPLETMPFKNYIEGVMIRGTYLDRAGLDEILEEVRSILNP